MLEWLEDKEIPFVVTATKSDKLSGNGRARAAAQLRRQLGDDLLLVSAQSGLGTKDIWSRLDRCLAEAKETKKDQSWTSKN